MMVVIIDALSWVCVVIGGFFVIVGAVGVLRFPDLFSRFHAAGVTDTLGAALILIGLMLQAGLSLITIKLILILAFGLFTSPTATHALAKAALHGKLKPLLSKKGA